MAKDGSAVRRRQTGRRAEWSLSYAAPPDVRGNAANLIPKPPRAPRPPLGEEAHRDRARAPATMLSL